MEVLLALLAAAAAAGICIWVTSRRSQAPRLGGHGIHPPAAWKEASGTIRVGTYNIHRGRGSDGRRDLGRIAAAIDGADVVGIQEAAASILPGGSNQARDLGRRLGLGWLFLPSQVRWLREQYGNGLLSRLPVGEWAREPLPDTTGRKHRNLTEARIDIGGGEAAAFLVTHLSKREDGTVGLRLALERMEARERAILVGDFNAARTHPVLVEAIGAGKVRDAIGEALGAADRPDRIDWILVRGFEVAGGGAVDVGPSDHPYYWVDLKPSPGRV